MKKLTVLALAAIAPVLGALPFTISTEDVTSQFVGAPRIQSFAFGQWEGRWVFVGGRSAGYHATGGAEAEFLRAQSNHQIFVMDPRVSPAKVYSASLDTLPESMLAVRDQLASTAQLWHQDGRHLLVAGGYGQSHENKWLTYPMLTVLDLPSLIDGVMKGSVPQSSVRTVETPLVQSTGGELMKLSDGFYYVVMGHNFTGSYTAFQGQHEKNRPAISQVYLNEIRKLKIEIPAGRPPIVTLLDTFRDESQFHRRDLNVVRHMSGNRTGLAVYGGVFTPDQLDWTKPVYLLPGEKPQVDSSFDQKMNTYACATMLLYDSESSAMYTTFFGGISRHYQENGKFTPHPKIGTRSDAVYLDGMQWSDQISTIRRSSEGTQEFVEEKTLPSFLGSDAVFIPAAGLHMRADSEIPDLAPLKGKRTFVGYLFGGVRTSPYRFPYTRTSPAYNSGTVPTKASDLVLKVYLDVPATQPEQ